MFKNKLNIKEFLVIGGGITGMTAAIEAAECGIPVILIEKESYLGGQAIGMNRYFPKNVPALLWNGD